MSPDAAVPPTPASGSGLCKSSRCPRVRCQQEWCGRQFLATAFPQLGLPRGIESSDIASGRPDAERERLPPFFEARMLDADRVNRLLDLLQSGGLEQLRKMALANACEVGLVHEL